jgi:hypothetical protein
VCSDDSCTGYRFAARVTVLHELAHAWEAATLDEAARAAELRRSGLETWMGASVPWAERGGERTAEIVMWGLLDHPVPLIRLGDPTCERLVAEFRLLTGSDPICGGCPTR